MAILWVSVIVYIVGAGIQDLRLRRVFNIYNYAAFAYFIALNVILHTWQYSIFGAVTMAVVFFYPTVLKVWGVGDWKVGIILGSSVGPVLAFCIWTLGFSLQKVKPLKAKIYDWSLLYMPEESASLIPLATLMAISTFIVLGFYALIHHTTF